MANDVGTQNMVRFCQDGFKKYELPVGKLRETDILRRIKYSVENAKAIMGRNAKTTDRDEIVDESIARSYGDEIAEEIKWDCTLAVQIAMALLQEVNCHAEAKALCESAKKAGSLTA